MKKSQEYDQVIEICRNLFINKMKDYGSAWRFKATVINRSNIYQSATHKKLAGK
jgi:hypothetical protein